MTPEEMALDASPERLPTARFADLVWGLSLGFGTAAALANWSAPLAGPTSCASAGYQVALTCDLGLDVGLTALGLAAGFAVAIGSVMWVRGRRQRSSASNPLTARQFGMATGAVVMGLCMWFLPALAGLGQACGHVLQMNEPYGSVSVCTYTVTQEVVMTLGAAATGLAAGLIAGVAAASFSRARGHQVRA